MLVNDSCATILLKLLIVSNLICTNAHFLEQQTGRKQREEGGVVQVCLRGKEEAKMKRKITLLGFETELRDAAYLRSWSYLASFS